MKSIGIIPARYASTRFPGKPLVEIKGKTMIRRVYERALGVFKNIYVATDDYRIADEVKSFGGNYVMTSSKHKSGTDRCAEALEIISNTKGERYDIVVNIQGDEPFIQSEQLELLLSCFENKNTQIATLVKKIDCKDELFNVNIPKVIINKNSEAIYFSRATIPYLRNNEKDSWLNNHPFYKHIGLYAYRSSVLIEITQIESSCLEIAESLEQLRWIENDYKIKVAITELENISVDTKEDLEKILNNNKLK